MHYCQDQIYDQQHYLQYFYVDLEEKETKLHNYYSQLMSGPECIKESFWIVVGLSFEKRVCLQHQPA